MKMTALAPWFGGKRNLAPQIVAELGEHRSYWEPFCGSMAVLLAKPECRCETVNDLHGDLVNLARVIQDAKLGPALYRRMRRAWCDETLFREAKARLAEPFVEGMGRACDYFYYSWVGRGGVSGKDGAADGFSVQWSQVSKGGYLDRAVSSIPAWRCRMRRVTVLNRDALGVLENVRDEDGTAIYVDPPYIAEGGAYAHNLATDQHHRLAEMLGRFCRARVVVSYYEHPLLKELYPPAKWTRVDNWVTRGTSASRGITGSEKRNDLLIINGPSYTREASLYATQISEETP
jgi:DNA adenine methylase